jgi:hypothetical protein
MLYRTYAIIRNPAGQTFCAMKYIDIAIKLLPLILPLLAASCIPREYPLTNTVTETLYRTEYVTESYTENETTVDAVTNSCELPVFYSWYSNNIAFNGQTRFWYIAYDIPRWPAYDNLRLTVSIWKQYQYELASIRILDMTAGGHLTTPDPAVYGDSGKGQVTWTWITPATTSSAGSSSVASSGGSSSAPTSSDSEASSEESSASTSTSGGASSTWLDTANVQINQSRFLGGRTNLWSRPEDPQVFELDAGRAQKIGIIICGPENQWNARVTLRGAFTRNIVSFKTVVKERQVEKQVPYQIQKQQTTTQVRQVPFWEIFSQ